MPTGTLRALEQPRLKADHELDLRPWRSGDAAAVKLAFESPEIQRWHVRRLDTTEEAQEWTAQWEQHWDDETAASWAIVDARDEPMGQIGLRNVSLSNAAAALSYWVTPSARGRGVAARAVRALTSWAFDSMTFNRLDLKHSTANVASCRVAARAGFVLEGTLRQAGFHADGWHDMHVHSRLRRDI